ncbi:methyltransferase domain-containing protein [Asanoa sp. NPDC049573]|uniref:class I SAM-dependent methyltransferase n=1 Tax=Asanoa sp. NPDC049573 TaxID=3155396 RepID=UPI00343997B9
MTAAFDAHERALWSGRAAAYRDSLAALCAGSADSLLDAAAVGAGDLVLDAGTGTGTVAALAVARGVRTVAVDAETGMLSLVRRRLPTVDLALAALPRLPFAAASFDAAVANFVVNHVGDPLAALRALRRVVRPGGRVAVTIWPHPPPPAQQIWADTFAAAGAVRPPDLPRVDADLDFPRSPEGLTTLLRRAGLAEVDGSVVAWTHHTDREAWWNGPANGIGATGTMLARQDPTTKARIRMEFDRITTPFLTDDGSLALPTSAVLAHGVVA